MKIRKILLAQLSQLGLCELLDLIVADDWSRPVIQNRFYSLAQAAMPYRDLVVLAAALRQDPILLEDILSLFLSSITYRPLQFLQDYASDLLEYPFPQDYGSTDRLMITLYSSADRTTLNAFDRITQEPMGHILLIVISDQKEPYGQLPIDFSLLKAPCGYVIYLKSLVEKQGVASVLLLAASRWANQLGLNYLLLERLVNLKVFYQDRGFHSLNDTTDSLIMLGPTSAIQAKLGRFNFVLRSK